jgi:hypothetical protein
MVEFGAISQLDLYAYVFSLQELVDSIEAAFATKT